MEEDWAREVSVVVEEGEADVDCLDIAIQEETEVQERQLGSTNVSLEALIDAQVSKL